jgi:hypothetical protein
MAAIYFLLHRWNNALKRCTLASRVSPSDQKNTPFFEIASVSDDAFVLIRVMRDQTSSPI